MSKLLAMMMKPKEYMYPVIKGSLTENPSGVFSGFSGSDYIAISNTFDITSNFEICVKINYWESTDSTQYFLSLRGNKNLNLYFSASGNVINCYYGSYWYYLASNLTIGEPITIKVSGNGTDITITIIQGNYSNTSSQSISEIGLSGDFIIHFGKGGATLPFTSGSIDLNQSYIKINNTKYQLQAVVGYTVVGSPTISNGIVSGFSTSNYLELNKSLNLSTEKVEIVLDIKLTSFSNDGLCILSANNGLNIQLYRQSTQYKLLNLGGNANSGTKQFVLNTNYKVKFVITSTTLDMYVWENNNWILDVSYTVNYTTISNIVIGDNYTHSGTRVFTGSIDLNETYIKVNNKLWFNGQPA